MEWCCVQTNTYTKRRKKKLITNSNQSIVKVKIFLTPISSSHSIPSVFKTLPTNFFPLSLLFFLFPKKKLSSGFKELTAFSLICAVHLLLLLKTHTLTLIHLGNCNVFRWRKTCCLKGKPQRTLSFSYTC